MVHRKKYSIKGSVIARREPLEQDVSGINELSIICTYHARKTVWIWWVSSAELSAAAVIAAVIIG